VKKNPRRGDNESLVTELIVPILYGKRGKKTMNAETQEKSATAEEKSGG